LRLTGERRCQIATMLRALRDSAGGQHAGYLHSDHGDMDSAHGWAHVGVYEEAVRIPFIVAFKGRLPAGAIDREHLISNGLDLLPTICDFAGARVPEGLAGRSVRPLLEGQQAPWRDFVVAESQNGRMVRGRDYKYCLYDRGRNNREMLVDLKADPGAYEKRRRLPAQSG